VDALQPIANQVGPVADEVLDDVDEQEVDARMQETFAMGRVLTVNNLGGGQRRTATAKVAARP
jgi:hypothetical protein